MANNPSRSLLFEAVVYAIQVECRASEVSFNVFSPAPDFWAVRLGVMNLLTWGGVMFCCSHSLRRRLLELRRVLNRSDASIVDISMLCGAGFRRRRQSECGRSENLLLDAVLLPSDQGMRPFMTDGRLQLQQRVSRGSGNIGRVEWGSVYAPFVEGLAQSERRRHLDVSLARPRRCPAK